MKLYIADAFTEECFGGNPAGVVILEDGEDFPKDEIMRKTAAELRYSETAFIKKLSDKEFNIRYFTPADEVDLCGHATIASFICLLNAGLVKDNREYKNKTLAGDLTIKIQNGFIMMEMAKPQYIKTLMMPEELEELYGIMGLEYKKTMYQESCSTFVTLLPTIISTGLPDIIMPVASPQQLEAISPDFPKLAELSKKYDAVGVHAFTLDRSKQGIIARCRNFAPLYDIDEEAATGTSSGALTYYLYRYRIIDGNRESAFIQGEAMGRPSKIYTYIRVEEDLLQHRRDVMTSEDEKNIDIMVGGNAVILAKGEIFL